MVNKVFNRAIRLYLFIGFGCLIQGQEKLTSYDSGVIKDTSAIYLVVLGTVQDGGSPHAGCQKKCCASLFENPDPSRKVVSLGLIDQKSSKKYLFEATPDLTSQMKVLKNTGDLNSNEVPDGIFLTHAHIGHYTGLMHLGKEALNASGLEVYAMPRMKTFLESNGPWSQLVSNQNIVLKQIREQQEISLGSELSVIPLKVPHRDEYSETVGYRIIGPNKSALFIPDIDKWEKWELNIKEEIKKVDYAFLDATFFDAEEVNYRDISEIPHPFIVESMERFSDMGPLEKEKVIFIHFNHTNPVLDPDSKASKTVDERGYRIARFKDVFGL